MQTTISDPVVRTDRALRAFQPPASGPRAQIPIGPAVMPGSGPARTPRSRGPAPAADTHTVVLAEGDPILRARLVPALEAAGLRTVATGLGCECLSMAEFEHPDLVILDVLLDDRNGLDVLGLLRSGHPALPVILITGSYSATAKALALEMGARAYVPGPLDAQWVLDEATKLLNGVKELAKAGRGGARRALHTGRAIGFPGARPGACSGRHFLHAFPQTKGASA
jgi:CheY-like chemotaxis protein